MKLFFALITTILSSAAFATVDGNDTAYIVVQHVQEETEFLVQPTAIIGCYGLSNGPQLDQLTKDYVIKSSVGCGWETEQTQNINYLTCAKVVSSKESSDYTTFSEITLDISGCDQKNNPNLEPAIRKAVKLNFNTKSVKTKLTLIK